MIFPLIFHFFKLEKKRLKSIVHVFLPIRHWKQALLGCFWNREIIFIFRYFLYPKLKLFKTFIVHNIYFYDWFAYFRSPKGLKNPIFIKKEFHQNVSSRFLMHPTKHNNKYSWRCRFLSLPAATPAEREIKSKRKVPRFSSLCCLTNREKSSIDWPASALHFVKTLNLVKPMIHQDFGLVKTSIPVKIPIFGKLEAVPSSTDFDFSTLKEWRMPIRTYHKFLQRLANGHPDFARSVN